MIVLLIYLVCFDLQTILHYETFLTGIGLWQKDDTELFPRFMLIAEETDGTQQETLGVGDTITGRMQRHLIQSHDSLCKHVDRKIGLVDGNIESVNGKIEAVQGKVKAMDGKIEVLNKQFKQLLKGMALPRSASNRSAVGSY